MALDIHARTGYIRNIGNEPTSNGETEMWTMDNTQGFTQTQLDLINDAIDLMDTDGIAESNVNDAINNAWADQSTAAELAADAAKQLKH